MFFVQSIISTSFLLITQSLLFINLLLGSVLVMETWDVIHVLLLLYTRKGGLFVSHEIKGMLLDSKMYIVHIKEDLASFYG